VLWVFSSEKDLGKQVTFSSIDDAELTDTPVVASEAHLQLALNCTSTERATVVVVDPGRENVIMFAGEEMGGLLFPSQQGKNSLEDTWRIDHTQLKCRRKADGQLVKLGEGLSPLPHPTPPHPTSLLETAGRKSRD
jgi:hypothetical protein